MTPHSPTTDGQPATLRDTVLDRATAKLASDPDLRAEIRAELATHLDDAEAAHRAAGSADPLAAALTDLGEPDSLATDLFAANRKRLRRRTVALAGGAVAIPATFLTTLALGKSAFLSFLAVLAVLAAGFAGPGTFFPSFLNERGDSAASYRSRLDARSRLILSLDRSPWRHSNLPAIRAVVLAGSSAERQAANLWLAEQAGTKYLYSLNPQKWEVPESDPLTFADVSALLADARAVDPTNGFPDLIEARLLFEQSAHQYDPDPSPTAPALKRYPWYSPRAPDDFAELEHVDITDRAKYERALELFHAAASKPIIANRSEVLFTALAPNLPTPTNLRERAERSDLLNCMLRYTPFFNQPRPDWEVLDRALRGDTAGARALLVDIESMGQTIQRSAADANFFLQGMNIVSSADYLRYSVARIAGDGPDAQRAAAVIKARDDVLHGDFAFPSEGVDRVRASVIEGERLSAWPVSAASLSASRFTEYALIDRVFILVFVLVLLAPAAWGVATLVRTKLSRSIAREPRTPWPRPREIVTSTAAALAPIAGYLALAWLTPALGRSWGLSANASGTLLQFAAVFAASCICLAWAVRRGTLRQVTAVGVPFHPRPLRTWVTVGLLLLAALTYCLISTRPAALALPAPINHVGIKPARGVAVSALTVTLAACIVTFGIYSLRHLLSPRVRPTTNDAKGVSKGLPFAALVLVTLGAAAVLMQLPPKSPFAARWACLLVPAAIWCWAVRKLGRFTPRQEAAFRPAIHLGASCLALAAILLPVALVLAICESHYVASHLPSPTFMSAPLRASLIAQFDVAPLAHADPAVPSKTGPR